MRVDFLSQATFDVAAERGRLDLPGDALAHTTVVENLLRVSGTLPPGSVIGLQASWGRGKTDVLARLCWATYGDEPPAGVAGRALWINPWQYGTPDLLSPLVYALAARVGQSEDAVVALKRRKTLEDAIPTLIAAGTQFGLKVAGAALPGMPLLTVASPVLAAAATGAGTLSGHEREHHRNYEINEDPTALMARRFRELVECTLTDDELAHGARLLVLIDDLDRCLPDRQVALLQALRFLLSAGAPVTFVLALDPVLARQAVVAHYRTDAFDVDRYLDKMFDMRLTLPELGPAAVQSLFDGELQVPVPHPDHPVPQPLRDLLPAGLQGARAQAAFPVPSLRNPRVLRRIADKLRLLAALDAVPQVQGDRSPELLLTYLGIAERWPQVRGALQSADRFDRRLDGIISRYTHGHPDHPPDNSPWVQALPESGDADELRALFKTLVSDRRVHAAWARFERELSAVGL